MDFLTVDRKGNRIRTDILVSGYIRENVKLATDQGQFCFAIKFTNPKTFLDRSQIKKGMVLINDLNRWKSNIVKKFHAKITILQHSTTIRICKRRQYHF